MKPIFKTFSATICVAVSLQCAVATDLSAQGLADDVDPIDYFRETPVSRFEWGLERYRVALVENFRIDPLTLQPSVPPFFINVNYLAEKNQIVVEIGRTFGSTQESRAREFCEQYLVQARSMLSVDRIGRAVVNGVSTLTQDFFHSPLEAGGPTPELARALDAKVMLRGLVVAPANGIYSVCATPLVGSPIHHIE